VVKFRADNGLSQTALGKMLGMKQPGVAFLEASEHEPSFTTLAKLSQVLGMDFSVDITPGRLELRTAAG
jgi:transcriptional regulator with XRE-family HTH domain